MLIRGIKMKQNSENNHPIYSKPEIQAMRKLYETLEPYQYIDFVDMLLKEKDTFTDYEGYDNYKWTLEGLKESIEVKNIKLHENIIPLIEDTDSGKKFDVHLPWRCFFVNQRFIFEDYIVNGFGLYKFGDKIHLLFFAMNITDEYEFFSNDEINNNIMSIIDEENVPTHDKKSMRHCKNVVAQFAYNLVNMINNQSKDFEYIELIADNNEKRIKRGKAPKRDVTFLRLSGELKIYAKYYSENRGKINVRYLVRGHWREFKSERYKDSKGKKKWIYPFYKGDPTMELINKKVIIKK
jgi:hypothetical protein